MVEIPKVDVPLVETPDKVDIPDVNVPLATLPRTGGIFLLWYLTVLLSTCGLAFLGLCRRGHS